MFACHTGQSLQLFCRPEAGGQLRVQTQPGRALSGLEAAAAVAGPRATPASQPAAFETAWPTCLGRLQVVVAAAGRVGGGQHRGARPQHGGDARLGDGDGLLLHGLRGALVRGSHPFQPTLSSPPIVQHALSRNTLQPASLPRLCKQLGERDNKHMPVSCRTSGAPRGWPPGPPAASCQTHRCTPGARGEEGQGHRHPTIKLQLDARGRVIRRRSGSSHSASSGSPRRRLPAPWHRLPGRTRGRRGPCGHIDKPRASAPGSTLEATTSSAGASSGRLGMPGMAWLGLELPPQQQAYDSN